MAEHYKVSILVVLEVVPEAGLPVECVLRHTVSILVVLEVVPEVRTASHSRPVNSGFNPCCSGSGSGSWK